MDLNVDRVYSHQPIQFSGHAGVIIGADFENNILVIELTLAASLVDATQTKQGGNMDRRRSG